MVKIQAPAFDKQMPVNSKKTILIVEDEIVTASLTSGKIINFGYNVIAANSASEAIHFVSNNNDISMVLMDIDLADEIDGTEAARQILTKRNIPIVFLTSHSEKEYVDRVKKITRYGYVIKNSGDFVLRSSIEMAYELFDAHENTRKNEALLLERTEQIQQAQQIAKIGTWNYDVETDFIEWSDSIYMIFGLDTGKPKPDFKKYKKIIHSEDFQQFQHDIDLALKEGLPFKHELRIIRSDGATSHLIGHGMAVKDSYGKVTRLFGIIQDITDRRHAIEVLRASEERFRVVSEYSHSAICIIDENEKIIWCNNKLIEISKFQRDEIYNAESFKSFLAPESISILVLNFQEFFAGRSYEHHFRFFLIRADGEKRLCDNHMIDYKDASGGRNLVLSMSDITDKMHAEEALQKSEEKLSSILNSMRDVVWSFSWPDLKFLYLTPSVEAMTGRPVADFINNPLLFQELTHPDDKNFIDKVVVQLIKYGSSERESRIIRKDGSIVWINEKRRLIYDEKGIPIRVDGTAFEITKRKLAEQALVKANANLTNVLANAMFGVVIIDKKRKIRWGNRNLCSLVGVGDIKDIIGKNCCEYLCPPGQKECPVADNGQTVENSESILRRTNGSVIPVLKTVKEINFDGEDMLLETFIDITLLKRVEIDLQRKNEELDMLLNSIGNIIIGVSIMDRITHWNPYVERLLGLKSQDVIGKQLVDSGLDWDWARVYEAISSCIVEDRPILLEDVIYHSKDGKVDLLEITVNPLKRSGEDLVGFILFGRDMTEQRKLENRLLQTRKLEAIGQLAAGVAHEINTPLQYVGDNLKFISKSLSGIIDLQYKLIQQRETSISGAGSREVSDSLKEYMHEIDLDYIVSELPKAVEQSIEGVLRVSKIVQSMKAFAHPGTGIKSPADINKSIENTATVSRNEWKYDCRLDLSLDPAMPLVSCYETELSQVVLNLIVNSVDAVKDAKKNGLIDQGIIRISTAVADNMAVICVEDNGQGIPDEIKHKIFDPFFTTKEVGKGTGQGLAIAHSIIVDKHGGQFEYAGEYGMGAVFIIRLPLYT